MTQASFRRSSTAPQFPGPLPAKDLVEARRKGLVVDNLSILLCRLEGLGYEIRNVFANQSVEVEMSGVDLLG